MKRISIIILLCLVSLAGFAQLKSQPKLFMEAAAIDGVTSVYISPALLRVGADVGPLGHGLDDAVKELRGLELISTELDEERHYKVREIGNRVIAAKDVELLVDINEGGEKVKLYAALEKDSPYSSELLLELDQEFAHYTIIYINGKIDISKLIKNNLNFR